MEAAVSSSMGAMGPVFRKLDLLLAPDYRLRKPLSDGIELLKEDLQEISCALVELSTLETPTQRAKCWMEEAREVSYLIDDFVDEMMGIRSKAGSKMRSVHRHRVGRVKIAQLPEQPRRSTRMNRINQLRDLLRQASERHERYQLEDCCSSSSHMITGHGRAPTLYGHAANLFGIEESRTKLIEMLTVEAEQCLKMVSIVGPAGIGKTTLAKEVFQELGGQFKLRVFVSVSRKLDMRRLLGSILSQICPHHQLASVSDSMQNLIDNVQEQLQDKRYFIVIDGLWEGTAWDIVSAAFPQSNNCSRIVATTESMNMALQCCGYMPDNILKMKPLGIQDSGNLFFSRVFGSEQQCPEELKEVSYSFIRKCCGIPLAVINLASLLASQLDYSQQWYRVHDHLCSILNRSQKVEEMQKEILNLSYNSLPRCLKTCLLYCNMYPEGYIMWKVHLVKQWIAEGFINAAEGEEAGEIAESYFDELVNRGMVQPMKIDYSDKVLSCTVNHIVLDLITHNSKEEEFISAIDYSQTIIGLSTKAHRQSFQFSSVKYARQPAVITMSQLRSFGFFGLLKCMPPIVQFKHLRVLILDFWGYHDEHMSLNISGISRLFLLRYLKISSDIMVELPAHMHGLHYLETLDIDARVSAVPLDIVHLPSLLHLGLRNVTRLPDGIGRIKSLSTLCYFDLSCNSKVNILSLAKLTNLQHLHVTCSEALSGDHLKRKLIHLVSSIGKFGNLKSLVLTSEAFGASFNFDISSGISSPPIFLQRLELLPPICFFFRLSNWIREMHKLRILKIVVKGLLENDINNIAGLPSLEVLALHVRMALTETVIFTNMTFPALKYFKFSCGVMCLAFEPGAMANLQRLKICFNAHRGGSHSRVLYGIEHLLNLQKVAGRIGDPLGADESDRRAIKLSFEDTIRKHPKCPRFNIRFVDFIEEEYPPLDKLCQRQQTGSSGEPDITEKDCAEAMNQHADSRLSTKYKQYSMPRWGFTSICGRRPMMQDAATVLPHFFEVPLWMVDDDMLVDSLDREPFRLPADFFGVYDGHGGVQVANYCRKRIHWVLREELSKSENALSGADLSGLESKKKWEKAFVNCFSRIDAEVGGNVETAAKPVTPESVGSTAVVAIILPAHLIVANCGNSRAVLCRGKQALPLSVDHNPNRMDEYARIEAQGGKIIQWNGYRVLGVLDVSRSIGDRYLKPYIIPDPEVTIVPRAKDDDLLILASDGLWDVVSNEEACNVARRRIRLWHKNAHASSSAQRIGESPDHGAQAAADYLSNLALKKGSEDNITVVVVDLKSDRGNAGDSRPSDFVGNDVNTFGTVGLGKGGLLVSASPLTPVFSSLSPATTQPPQTGGGDMAASDLESKAKDAFIDDDFELATELYTQAIDAGSATADLYANRAQAYIKLGNYTKAVADANKAIVLDPTMHKAYYRKGAACMKLEKYQTAKAALELGFSYANGDSRFTRLLKECDERIAAETAPRPSHLSSKEKKTDKLEAEVKKEEKDEILDGDGALDRFFNYIYKEADEDMRRTMRKIFVESNRTDLSKNSKDFGPSMVEGSPHGMEFNKWY